MTVLSILRQEVVDALKAVDDLNLYTHVPGRMALPGAFVMAGSPYVEQDVTFDSRLVRFEVIICAPAGDNDAETSALDELIEAAMHALESDKWVIESVSQPYSMEFNNAQGLVTSITITSDGVSFN